MEIKKQNEPEVHMEIIEPIPAPAEPTAEQPSEIPQEKKSRKKDDPVVIGLMFGVSFLSLCIIGVMLYWLAAFLS